MAHFDPGANKDRATGGEGNPPRSPIGGTYASGTNLDSGTMATAGNRKASTASPITMLDNPPAVPPPVGGDRVGDNPGRNLDNQATGTPADQVNTEDQGRLSGHPEPGGFPFAADPGMDRTSEKPANKPVDSGASESTGLSDKTRDISMDKPVDSLAGISGGNSAGNSQGKPGGNSTGQQLSEKIPPEIPPEKTDQLPPKSPAGLMTSSAAENGAKRCLESVADFFRYEVECEKVKKGYLVTIRKRLKWSNARTSRQVARGICPDLTTAQVQKIRDGNLTASIMKTISNNDGNITNEHIKLIKHRNGRGVGIRSAELDAGSKLLLARFERMLSKGTGTGSNRNTVGSRRTDRQNSDVSKAQTTDLETLEPLPYVQ